MHRYVTWAIRKYVYLCVHMKRSRWRKGFGIQVVLLPAGMGGGMGGGDVRSWQQGSLSGEG